MRTSFLILLLSLSSFFTWAQDSTGTISVTGKAAVYQIPELIAINLNLVAEDADYNICVQKAMTKMENLKKDFSGLGIKADEIKMQSFNINEQFDWKEGKRVSRGFEARMALELEANYDKKFMTKLLKVLSQNATDVNYQFAFKLSEDQKEKAKEELTKKAVQDAKQSAGYLASASGVHLKTIKRIQLGQQQDYQPIQHRDMMVQESMMKANDSGANFNFDFAPKEIALYQTVQIIWVIE